MVPFETPAQRVVMDVGDEIQVQQELVRGAIGPWPRPAGGTGRVEAGGSGRPQPRQFGKMEIPVGSPLVHYACAADRFFGNLTT